MYFSSGPFDIVSCYFENLSQEISTTNNQLLNLTAFVILFRIQTMFYIVKVYSISSRK